MSLPITCSECDDWYTNEDEFETCLDCGKQNICSACIRTLSQEGNSYYGCIECSDKETKMIEKRQSKRRQGIVDSILLSCHYRGVIDDPSMTLLDALLDDYVKNGTRCYNKEIFIVNNDKVDNGKALGIKYKMVLNLYNHDYMGDTFTINSA